MRHSLRAAALLLIGSSLSPAARLSQPAQQAFETYITTFEAHRARQHASPGRSATPVPAPSAVQIEPVNGGSWEVTGGLVHHWRATAFVPNASASELLALLRDSDHLARYYAPRVVASRALTGEGGRAAVAMRFKEQRVITVVLDAEFEAESGLTGGGRGYSISRSTHIWQVDQPGTAEERRREEGADDGFLWHLNSYWGFEQKGEGLLMECEAVSLTRDIPAGLSWLIAPIVESLPRASLEFTMTATRNALAASALTKHDEEAHR